MDFISFSKESKPPKLSLTLGVILVAWLLIRMGLCVSPSVASDSL